ncbi:hypothetical protein [Anaeromyxobacter paludicola]|uniref:Lipoprotein n=1 Tax=Anaeromyxobacter paludicola TaxID=2918171 RepID=A0ABN6N6C4_9BACT|nr:hypothetical protein [Anaeromyxobacter paludicola]BDG08080.1 hypothetical protein AMPC_11930 [Anaeromyxobacter paludicola]
MNRSAALACTALLAACGGSSSSSSSAVPSGKVANANFTPTSANAAVLSSAACNAGGFTVNLSAVALGFSSTANLCGRLGQTCTDKANEVLVTVAIVNAGVTAQPPVAAGSYQVTSAVPSTLSGPFALAFVKKNDAQCNDSQSATSVTGSVNLATVSATHVTGSVNLTLSDGGNLTGNFDVPVCSTQGLDVCQALSSCSGQVTCQP